MERRQPSRRTKRWSQYSSSKAESGTLSLYVKGDTFVSITQDAIYHYPNNWARSGVWNLNKIEQIWHLLSMEIVSILVYRLYKMTVPKLPFSIRTNVFSRYFEIKFWWNIMHPRKGPVPVLGKYILDLRTLGNYTLKCLSAIIVNLWGADSLPFSVWG